MTDQPKTAVNLDRLAQLLDAYGGESARWPEQERAAALQLIAASPEAAAMQRSALELDSVLSLDVLPEVASSALRARVLEIPIRHPRAERAAGWDWKRNWMFGLFALTPCVIGFISGTMLMDPSSDADEEAWDELAQVVAPAALTDELDMFDEDSL
jgi:hypothetical protein